MTEKTGPLVNGRYYPLWQQFIDEKDRWIGGKMVEMDGPTIETVITGMKLEPNGAESAFFTVEGKDFNCGFDVHAGGLSSCEEPYVVGFRRLYMGEFVIYPKDYVPK